MDEATKMLLLDVLALGQGNQMRIHEVLMLGSENFTQAEKDDRLSILREIEADEAAYKRVFDRIRAA